MKLSVAERLQFPILYPEKGDFLTMTIKQDIIKKVSFTQEEIEKIKLKSDDGVHFSWDKEAKETEIDFTEAELVLLKKKLEELDKAKELDSTSFAFYKKFFNS